MPDYERQADIMAETRQMYSGTSNLPVIGEPLGGKYRIIKKIGEGGMGVVYAAENVELGMRVALKLLNGEVIDTRGAAERFRKEARAASAVDHDNVIRVYDFGALPDGQTYLVMEFL